MKEFIKNISIYGLLPVIGKFMGFFLVPIYARIFSSDSFGQIELIITLISFMMYLVNLEFYSAIGRYFYDRGLLQKQARLISTGLILTTFSALVVLLLCFLSENLILSSYLNNVDLKYELRVGFIWLFISAFSTYLSVIPRYAKKPKLYVLLNSASLLFRLLCTILFVVVWEVGIVGIIYGHICGASLSLVLNTIISRQFLVFNFDKKDARAILKYALPIIPGLIVAGAWQPLFVDRMNLYFSVSIVGLYAFASRITSITTMFNGALRNAWRPMLYENINNPQFILETKSISGKVSYVILTIGVFTTLLSPEICLLIGTKEYLDSAILVPFLVFAGYLQIGVQLRGFGPLINNKTYINSLVSLAAVAIAIFSFTLFKNNYGLVGLGLVLVIYDLFQYVVLYLITYKFIRQTLMPKYEYVLILLIVLSTLCIVVAIPLIHRIIVGLFFFSIIIYLNIKHYKILVI